MKTIILTCVTHVYYFINCILHENFWLEILYSFPTFLIFIYFSYLSSQAQFILCIAHTIRALCTECNFPSFVSALLLLNASIFFVLFMNFYIQAYKKQPTSLEKKIDWWTDIIFNYNIYNYRRNKNVLIINKTNKKKII